jgi:cytochrome c peroxidase
MVSCASCHKSAVAFAGNEPRSVGVNGFLTNRHAPPLFNLYIYKSFMADGRASDLPHQHLLPLESAEMAIDWATMRSELGQDLRASSLTKAAGISELNRATTIKALASFVASLVSGGSRFARLYYGGDSRELSAKEQRGMRLFTHEARCSTCHLVDGTAAPMTDGSFHVTGIGFAGDRFKDRGRFEVTRSAADDGAFKTPTLRNVSLRDNFMHNGSLSSLRVC